MTPEEYCRAKATPSASSQYYALYFADRELQPALAAVLAFRVELGEVVQECSDHGVAATKLNWWREELARAYAGEGRHPVSQALQQPLQRYKLSRALFEQIIEGAEMDLEYGRYPSFNQLSLYCHRLGIAPTQLMVEICGYHDRASLAHAHHLGMALQLTQLLRNVRRDARAGRCYIPEDELEAAGLTPDDLLGDKTSERLSGLFAKQAERIDEFFDQAYAQLPEADRWPQRSGIILAELYRALLYEMRADSFPLLEREYHLTPIRKLWLAWRTARKQKPYKRASA